MYENKVTIMGNLTKKPELRTTENGQLCYLNIAVNSTWVDRNTGERKENVEFIGVTVFGKQAENCAQYLDIGQKVYCLGKIKNRVEETEGGKRYHTGIVAERVQFGPKSGQNSTKGAESSNLPDKATDEAGGATQTAIDYPDDDNNLENIPF